jgi:hypothetical protein
MIDNCNDGGGGIVSGIADWRDCDGLEVVIEVPVLKPMRIACDDRGFIAIYVISVIAVTARMLIFVLVFVVVRFTRGIVVMDVRMVSSAMTMIERAHDIDRMSANRKWSLHRLKEDHLSAVRSMRCPDWDGAEQVINDAQLVGEEQPKSETQKS